MAPGTPHYKGRRLTARWWFSQSPRYRDPLFGPLAGLSVGSMLTVAVGSEAQF